jgi:hypothetical protein
MDASAPIDLVGIELFPDIRVEDGLGKSPATNRAIVLLNPPFNLIDIDEDWKKGRGSAAAVFVMSIIRGAPDGTRLAAILPDVLRSGSSYEAWRREVARRATIDRVEIVGRFDQWTDVDVFVLRLRIGESADFADWPSPKRRTVLGNTNSVRVGSVVPHRHRDDTGVRPRVRYATPGTLPPGAVIDACELPLRGFAGHTAMPPFVGVRRTSSPGDRHRLVASVVIGSEPVAVENHLLVVKPIEATVERCHEVAARLREPEVATWLNKRLRCRHLTVAAVREIPWEPGP